jgi:hypothetical protein
MVPVTVTAPCARKYSGPGNTDPDNFSVAPAAIWMVLKLYMFPPPTGAALNVVTPAVLTIKSPSAPVEPLGNVWA